MTNPSRAELVSRLRQAVERLITDLHPADPEELSLAELTMPQFRTLMMLDMEPQRMSDIAALLRANLSSATSMVDRLEAKGLVERAHSTDDRRVVTARLTTAGRTEVARFWRISQRQMDHVTGALKDDELEAVIRGLDLLATASQRTLAADRIPPDGDKERPSL